MEVGKNGSGGVVIDTQQSNISAQQVVKAAHGELLQLLAQRAGLMKRIGTLKQTIAGLADLPVASPASLKHAAECLWKQNGPWALARFAWNWNVLLQRFWSAIRTR